MQPRAPTAKAKRCSRFGSWLNLVLLNTYQAIVRAYIDVPIALGQRGHIRGGQSVANDAPALFLSIVKVESVAESSGEHVILGDQHGAGVDLDRGSCGFVSVESTRTV